MNHWVVQWENESGDTVEQDVQSLNDALTLSTWIEKDGTSTTMKESNE